MMCLLLQPISEMIHVSQPDDQTSRELRSPEEGELDDTDEMSSMRIPSILTTDGESSSVTGITVTCSESVVESSK